MMGEATIEHANRAVQRDQDAAGGDAGSLAIGYRELPEAGKMTPIIRRYKELYPGFEVTLRNMPAIQQSVAFVDGSIDVAFLHPPLSASQLVLRPAGSEDIVAVLHSSCSGDTCHLVSEPLIICAEKLGPFMYNSIVAACGRAGFQPLLQEEMFRWHSMLDQASSGLGSPLVPEPVATSIYKLDALLAQDRQNFPNRGDL